MTTKKAPYDPNTFIPYNGGTPGTALAGIPASLPVRFSYLPALHYATPRTTVVTGANGGSLGAVDVPAGN